MNESMRDRFDDSTGAFARDVEEGAADASERMRDGAQSIRDRLQDGADAAEEGLRRTKHGVASAGSKVANAVRDGGDYFREHGAGAILKDVEGLVREHPGKAMLGMAAVGFLIGRSLKQRS